MDLSDIVCVSSLFMHLLFAFFILEYMAGQHRRERTEAKQDTEWYSVH